jgi:hypothetical protein
MAQYTREAVARILTALLAGAEADERRFAASRDYHGGRVSGLRTALELLTMDENDALPTATAKPSPATQP